MNAARYGLALAASVAFLGIVSPAQAQVDDGRWLAFIGCWQPTEGSEEAGLVCFRPAAGGVEMTSVVDGEVRATEQLAADGQPRPVAAEGCEGTEALSFSEDGRRVFTTSSFTCGGEERAGTGVMAVVAPNRWVDVRALEIRGETVAWVQSYQLVGIDRLAEEGIDDPREGMETTVRAARMAAATSIDVDDVTEATGRIDQEAVVAWVAAQGDELDLDGEELLRLADAGVPEEVIDVMVAVSYPDRFVVEPEQDIAMADAPAGRRIPVGVGYRGYMAWDPFYHGYYPFGFGFRHSPYAFGYSPFGYGYGLGPGYGYYGWGYRPVVVRVERRGGEGRMIRGEGFRPGSGAVPSTRGAQPRGGNPGGFTGARATRGAGAIGSSRPSTRGAAQPRTARRRGGE